MKLAGSQSGTRLGREDPKRVIAQVLRSRITTEFDEYGSVMQWANNTADAVLDALRNNGDLT